MTYTSTNIRSTITEDIIAELNEYDELITLDEKFYEGYTLTEVVSYNRDNDIYSIVVECLELDEEFEDFNEAETAIDDLLNEWEQENKARDVEYWASR